MTKSSYREPDYAFGQRMLTLRTAVGLTQAALADHLGVSRHAVGGWETGQTYPTADHLKHFIALALQQRAFAAGREAAEIQALWRAAHQKVLLDERWLHALLSRPASPSMSTSVAQTSGEDLAVPAPVSGEPRVDWGDALDVPTFYGRAEELALLSRWVVAERCRVVSVLGMGGVGKSALAVTVMHQVAPQFAVVIWRSLRDAPACDALVADCLQVLAPRSLRDLPDALDARLRLLMEQLRERRVLLVLDNLEMLLEEGTGTGRMRAGLEDYAQLLRRMGETAHQSCLLLTSREKPAELVPLEGTRSPVRVMRLGGLDTGAGGQILGEKDVAGSPHDRARLVEAYGGNPLALKIVAQSIVELFGGEIGPFLEQGEVVFGGVRQLLDEQVARLSMLEQRVFFWLAILREPVRLEELQAVLGEPPAQVLEAMDGLRRRSLIERGHWAGTFTLQSVVLEYATTRLIAEARREIQAGQLERLIQHGLCQAQAKEYVRQTQERLLLVPLLSQLQSIYQGQAALEARFHWLLDQLRDRAQQTQGYGPANLVALLRVLRGNLRDLDLSQLALRGVPLQDIEMQDTRLSGAVVQESVFTEAFDAVEAIAVSSTGQYWAAATWRGKVRVWGDAGKTLHRIWSAHISNVSALGFSPDGRTLVSASFDNTIKLWEVASGALLWVGLHGGSVNGTAFAPDGHLLASGGNDGLVHVWDVQSGAEVRTLAPQGGMVNSVAWSPDGRLLASGCADGSIWIWNPLDAAPDTPVQILARHTHWVPGLAFAPDSSQLASASFDGAVKLWDMNSGACLQTFAGHTAPVIRIAWSPDGRALASCGVDLTIWLWDVKEGRSRAVLHGHTAVIYSVAFTPDSRSLLSCSDDGAIRVWDVDNGQCVRIIGGYLASLLDIDWSPDGTRLACGGADTLVTLWDAVNTTALSTLRGHRWLVRGVAWSPDGQLLASAGYDNSIGLWDTVTGMCLYMLQDPDAADTIFFSVAWSPDGRMLACGSYMRGMQVWDVATRSRRWVERAHPDGIHSGTWSPDGTRLAGGGDDGYVYVWDAADGTLLWRLAGHAGVVMSVAWSSDGMRLASGGGGSAGGEIFVWDAQSGERVRALAEQAKLAAAVVWDPNGELLISGGSDGMLRWWEIESGVCVRVRAGHQGTVQALKATTDGGRLASCGDDGAIVVWDQASGEQLQTLRRDRPYERMDIKGLTGITEAQRASLVLLGAVDVLGDG